MILALASKSIVPLKILKCWRNSLTATTPPPALAATAVAVAGGSLFLWPRDNLVQLELREPSRPKQHLWKLLVARAFDHETHVQVRLVQPRHEVTQPLLREIRPGPDVHVQLQERSLASFTSLKKTRTSFRNLPVSNQHRLSVETLEHGRHPCLLVVPHQTDALEPRKRFWVRRRVRAPLVQELDAVGGRGEVGEGVARGLLDGEVEERVEGGAVGGGAQH
mmetsp:Transcript_62655/g.125535  ORF Transcript_62655/g.125535 Transcript_62655/m.125535 type:complete len:221 (-) Transcript_62655:2115-2777(-)